MNNDRKRLLFHCTHMGMMENDVIFGGFARKYLENLSDQEVSDLELVLKNSDLELFTWVSGKEDVPQEWNTSVMELLKKYCNDSTA